MRPRRGFDRPPEEPRTRINEAIRVPQVRLIGADGEQIGLKDRDDALEYAWDLNLDLVEVAADARPPVCRVMDYSKYKYEQEQKAKLARKHQNVIVIKEIKLRPKVGAHDYETKKGHVVRFLKNHDKVKVTIMFRGREMTHPERGRDLLLRLAEDLKELAVVESEPLQDGRNMVMMLAPSKQLLKEENAESAGSGAAKAPLAVIDADAALVAAALEAAAVAAESGQEAAPAVAEPAAPVAEQEAAPVAEVKAASAVKAKAAPAAKPKAAPVAKAKAAPAAKAKTAPAVKTKAAPAAKTKAAPAAKATTAPAAKPTRAPKKS
ncbi:MAG: translation initiation factor IF-3 [Thermoleophilia bacterium]|nr:translation initiation factor IF-3 [Thermoleophilia bacterium]